MEGGETMAEEKKKADIIYNIHDKPPAGPAVVYALQHILAMFSGNVTVPLLVVGIAGLSSGEGTLLIQCALLMAGVVTLLQVAGAGPVGSRLPVVMGTSNGFLSTVSLITTQYGIGACLGASFIGGLFECVLGSFLNKLKKVFTPLVSGIVVMTIGLTLIPTGIKAAAGGSTQEGLGAPVNLFLSGIVILTIIICSCVNNKMLKSASILAGIVVGYVTAALMGKVDFTSVLEASWIGLPGMLHWKWEFRPAAIVIMLFMYLATTIETVGDISALTIVAEERQPTLAESRGAVLADGLGSALAAVFNAFPNTSYTQNIGVVNLTGVFSNFVVTIGAGILVVLSLFPKVAAVILCVPQPVLGGATLITFVMVFISGIELIRSTDITSRDMLIMAISLGIGVGFNLVPDAMAQLPGTVSICMTSGIIPASILAVFLDRILPGRKE